MLKSEVISNCQPLRQGATFRKFSAALLLAGAWCVGASAQQAVSPAEPLVASVQNPPLSLAAVAGLSYSSSADVANPVDVSTVDHLALAGMQPPPRRRYGRPRYNDSSHNPDGSNKYAFVAGVGFTGPVGNTYHYLNTSYGIQVGGGRNFNKNFSVLAQFDYDRFGFNGRTLYNQEAVYNYYCTPAAQFAGLCSLLTSLDGNSHIWSFTVNPSFNFYQNQGVGAYVVGGVGFYHKVANFTTPEQGVGYDPYYGYYSYTANAVIDHYTSNAPGFNGGVGLTFKPSRFAGERLFLEGRYHLILNQQRTGINVANINSTFGQAYAGYNDYPANSNRTTYLAFKAGIRF